MGNKRFSWLLYSEPTPFVPLESWLLCHNIMTTFCTGKSSCKICLQNCYYCPTGLSSCLYFPFPFPYFSRNKLLCKIYLVALPVKALFKKQVRNFWHALFSVHILANSLLLKYTRYLTIFLGTWKATCTENSIRNTVA